MKWPTTTLFWLACCARGFELTERSAKMRPSSQKFAASKIMNDQDAELRSFAERITPRLV